MLKRRDILASIEERVESLLKEKIEAIGYELYDVEYSKEGKNYFLRIFIIDDGSLSCYNRLENKKEYKQVEIRKFEPKYKNYTYQIVVLEKIK